MPLLISVDRHVGNMFAISTQCTSETDKETQSAALNTGMQQQV